MSWRSAGLWFVRYGIAGLSFIAGVAILSQGDDVSVEGGAMFMGAGIAILMLNVIFRYGVVGDTERGKEERAREFFDRYGHWPDEPGQGHEAERERREAEPRRAPERDPLRPRRGPGPRVPRRRG
ncbi:MAG: hypothetical protein IRZ21_10195 [Thermoleophilaceae bacterium]|nr:hypothetical protein [Thermoleophilaceae bacterium]